MTIEAYGMAYKHGFERTIRLLLSRGARAEYAEEAAQAAWAMGWERIGQLRNEDAVRTWVNTIALNCYRRVMRSQNRRLPLRDVLTSANINVQAIDLGRFLNQCHPADRRLFEDYLEGYRLQEIACRQGISYAATRIRLFRARRVLQSMVDDPEAVRYGKHLQPVRVHSMAA
jgi:DNA-directed RNA polymerase specialized sigma24 family protein